MRLAILGGSFNPLHNGHAMLADTVIRELKYDRILFIPTFIAPHKFYADVIKAEDRLAMVKAFCDSEDGRFQVETCEIERSGVSYTVDTLEYLVSKYEGKIEGKPGLIMGQEIAAEFDKWKKPDRIADLADIIIVPRNADYSLKNKSVCRNMPAGAYKGDFAQEFSKEKFKYPFLMLEKPLVTVSSTEIRNRIKNGESYKYLVPPAVYDYIEKNGLYRK